MSVALMGFNAWSLLLLEKVRTEQKEKAYYFQEDLSHTDSRIFQTDIKSKMSPDKHLLDSLAIYPNYNPMVSSVEMLVKTRN